MVIMSKDAKPEFIIESKDESEETALNDLFDGTNDLDELAESEAKIDDTESSSDQLEVSNELPDDLFESVVPSKESINNALVVSENEAIKEALPMMHAISSQLAELVEKAQANVSPEFNALMEGYVAKANESETIKVKAQHVHTQHKEMKAELQNTRDDLKRIKVDLEASKEALRSSELDLSAEKTQFSNYKDMSSQKISDLSQDKLQLKDRVAELERDNGNLLEENSRLKSELLETQHRVKEAQQDGTIELEDAQRKIIDLDSEIIELKEQLDLRIREIEYKDALLNQLVKQQPVVSPTPSPEPVVQPSIQQAEPVAQVTPNIVTPEPVVQEVPSFMESESKPVQEPQQSLVQDVDTMAKLEQAPVQIFEPAPETTTVQDVTPVMDSVASSSVRIAGMDEDEEDEDEPPRKGFKWGAFRK